MNKDEGMLDEATAEDTLPSPTDHNKLPSAIMNLEEDLREEYDHIKALPPGEVYNNQPMTLDEMEDFTTSLKWNMMSITSLNAFWISNSRMASLR